MHFQLAKSSFRYFRLRKFIQPVPTSMKIKIIYVFGPILEFIEQTSIANNIKYSEKDPKKTSLKPMYKFR